MRKIKKLCLGTLFVAFIMIFFSIFGEFNVQIIKEPCIRDISFNETSTLSFESKVAQELEKFEAYDIFISEENTDILVFNGDRKIPTSEMLDCDFINFNEQNVDLHYNLSCNKKTNEITGIITYEQHNELISQQNINFNNVIYNESDESVILSFEDGTVIDSSKLLDTGNVDECMIEAAVAGIAVVIETVVILVLVAVVVYVVIFWLFPWLKKKITSWRYEEKVVNQVKTIPAPAITIDGIRYDTKVKTKSEIKALPRVRDYIPIYYLAFASGVSETNGIVDPSLPDGGLFIGSEISFSQAIEVLTTNVVSEVVRDGTTFTYIPSVYAYNESNILSVMDIVSYHSQTPRNNPEWHFIGNSSVTGLPHYHPNEIYDISVKKGNGTKSYRHHAFFLNFDVTTWLGYQYIF